VLRKAAAQAKLAPNWLEAGIRPEGLLRNAAAEANLAPNWLEARIRVKECIAGSGNSARKGAQKGRCKCKLRTKIIRPEERPRKAAADANLKLDRSKKVHRKAAAKANLVPN
jgi:hypothetical protein